MRRLEAFTPRLKPELGPLVFFDYLLARGLCVLWRHAIRLLWTEAWLFRLFAWDQRRNFKDSSPEPYRGS